MAATLSYAWASGGGNEDLDSGCLEYLPPSAVLLWAILTSIYGVFVVGSIGVVAVEKMVTYTFRSNL